MMTGRVTADREAVIRLTVRGPAHEIREMEAIVDTGRIQVIEGGEVSIKPLAKEETKR